MCVKFGVDMIDWLAVEWESYIIITVDWDSF